MTAYASALSAGASLFLMGENVSFMTRNTSLFQFADQLGGGQLTFASGSDTQAVLGPLNTNGLASVTFNAGGRASAVGLTGVMATVDTANSVGTTFVWPVGSLAAAPAGKLTMVLDVNFNVAANDTLDVSTVSVAAPPTLGVTLVDAATGAITYTANAGTSGVDTFSYRVCLTNTPSICETSTVTVTVGAQAPVVARPVPAMGGWGLAALLGLMGWTATRRRHTR